ncbi:putative ribonuclease H domain-containing protein [Arabidopsis thaliana]
MYLDQNSTKAKTTCVFTQWVYANLDEGAVVEGSSLATFFTISVWWRWKWWCGNIFGQNGVCRDRVKFVKDTGKEVALAKLVNMGNEGMISREERMIGWGLRDSDGAWCGGFGLNIGKCSAPLAELWGVYYGLYLAWERKATEVELEIDSKMVVGLTTGICEYHPLSFLV